MMTNKQPTVSRFIRFLKRVSIITGCLLTGLLPLSANAFDIRMGTGETGTFSHFAGRIICRLIDRQTDDIDCRVVPASGDVHNLTNLQGGSLDIGLVDSRMLQDAINKSGHFEFLDIRYDNLRLLAPLYDIPVALVVRRDAKIASLDDLKGKRLNAGAPRSPQHLAVDTIMAAKSWSANDFSLIEELPASQSQDTMAFCHGSIQAMVHIGVHPDSSLQQLFKLCTAELVSMDDKDIEKLIDTHPAFFKIDIAANTYPTNTQAVTTFGTRAYLVASESLDKQTVYQIMAAIDTHRERLRHAHPALFSFTDKDIGKDKIGVPLHPGAAKFFSEPGH